MIRRIAFAATLAAAAVLPATAAAAVAPVGVEDDFFAPDAVSASVGLSPFTWIWDLDGSSGGATVNSHNVVSRDGLFASDLVNSGTYEVFASAGAFGYFCVLHQGMTGTLRVAPSGGNANGANPFKVAWAKRGANTGNRFDVRFKVGDARWRTWLEDTRSRSQRFGRGEEPVAIERNTVYSFQARSQAGANEAQRSGWSPTVRIRT